MQLHLLFSLPASHPTVDDIEMIGTAAAADSEDLEAGLQKQALMVCLDSFLSLL